MDVTDESMYPEHVVLRWFTVSDLVRRLFLGGNAEEGVRNRPARHGNYELEEDVS